MKDTTFNKAIIRKEVDIFGTPYKFNNERECKKILFNSISKP